MSELEQKIYQLIINRLDGNKISSGPYREGIFALVRKGIGGFVVFGGKKNEIRTFIAELRSLSERTLFIASDIERGVGQQVEGATSFPSQMAVAAAISKDRTEDIQLLHDAVKAIAVEAIDIGINMPLIPVLDVNQNPDNPIISTRAFSDNPGDVSWYGSTYVTILEESGLISCAKHFPGHGDTDIDSHISLPVISKSAGELRDADLAPFCEAVKAGVSSIMIGHLSIPGIDSRPSSLSEKVISGLLRTELGFKGLVLTDALNMHALNEYQNVPATCINAGVDILLHPADAEDAAEALKQAVASGEIEEKRIDAAVERILAYKSKIEKIYILEADIRKHRRLSDLISEKSVTLLEGSAGAESLDDIRNAVLVYVGDEHDLDVSLLKEAVSSSVHIEEVSPARISSRQTVIFALFTSIAAWKGSSGISSKDRKLIRECIEKSGKAVVIAFGSPYVLRHFKEADMRIAAYDSGKQAQDSVMKCLRGVREFSGRLPVKIV
jgi:beta-glucosidase-like glycosyl hydrolase